MLTKDDFKKNEKLKDLISDKVKEDCWILYPARYHKVELADQHRIFGVVAIIDENNNYILMNLPVKVKFNFTEVSTLVIDDITYKKLKIEKGTPLFSDKEFVSTKDDTYVMLDDWLINSNNIPFYIDYNELLDVFIKNRRMVGGDLARDIVAISMLISIIARNNKGDFYRMDRKGLNWVGLSNKNESYKNLSSMLGGTYLSQGIDNALLLEDEDKSALSKMMGA